MGNPNLSLLNRKAYGFLERQPTIIVSTSPRADLLLNEIQSRLGNSNPSSLKPYIVFDFQPLGLLQDTIMNALPSTIDDDESTHPLPLEIVFCANSDDFSLKQCIKKIEYVQHLQATVGLSIRSGMVAFVNLFSPENTGTDKLHPIVSQLLEEWKISYLILVGNLDSQGRALHPKGNRTKLGALLLSTIFNGSLSQSVFEFLHAPDFGAPLEERCYTLGARHLDYSKTTLQRLLGDRIFVEVIDHLYNAPMNDETPEENCDSKDSIHNFFLTYWNKKRSFVPIKRKVQNLTTEIGNENRNLNIALHSHESQNIFKNYQSLPPNRLGFWQRIKKKLLYLISRRRRNSIKGSPQKTGSSGSKEAKINALRNSLSYLFTIERRLAELQQKLIAMMNSPNENQPQTTDLFQEDIDYIGQVVYQYLPEVMDHLSTDLSWDKIASGDSIQTLAMQIRDSCFKPFLDLPFTNFSFERTYQIIEKLVNHDVLMWPTASELPRKRYVILPEDIPFHDERIVTGPGRNNHEFTYFEIARGVKIEHANAVISS